MPILLQGVVWDQAWETPNFWTYDVLIENQKILNIYQIKGIKA